MKSLIKIIKEEMSDFDWAEGPINFTIDDIVGKQMYYRANNLSDAETKLEEIPRNEIVLGKIRWNRAFKLDSYNSDEANINVGDGSVRYSVNDVVSYVNLGIWALEDENGNIINDFSGKYLKESKEDFDWAEDIEPEMTQEALEHYYNKPFYWLENDGKLVQNWGMPRIFWFELGGMNDRVKVCYYRDTGYSVSAEPFQKTCSSMLKHTVVKYIKRGTFVFQPQLSDIKAD